MEMEQTNAAQACCPEEATTAQACCPEQAAQPCCEGASAEQATTQACC